VQQEAAWVAVNITLCSDAAHEAAMSEAASDAEGRRGGAVVGEGDTAGEVTEL